MKPVRLSDSFVTMMFLYTWRYTMFKSIPNILIVLTNKNVPLVYSITICQQNKGLCTDRKLPTKTAAPLFLYLLPATFHKQSPY